VAALWKGLPPAVARGLFYGGLRLGLYNPIKSLMAGAGGPQGGDGPRRGPAPKDQAPVGLKVAAGSLSGGLAAALSSPTELIKARRSWC
jgi:solute carrier family 25 uncoupling protein 8/9